MNLVFAHFGSPIPKHLLLNLKRAIILFPLHKIFLVTDLDIQDLEIKNVIVYKYVYNSEWWRLQEQLHHSKSFRSNFWFTSTARFLALADFSNFNNDEFLHIESDVIISEDFPFTKLSNSNYDIMFPIVSDSNAIASCLYIRNSDAAKYLADLTLLESQENNLTTDMYILSILSKKDNLKFVPLPTAPSNCYLWTESNTRFLQMSDAAISYFGGVFDGFDIGRYIFGDDPRNRRGFSILRDNDTRTYLDVKNLDLVTKIEREFPYVWENSSDSYIPVFSLHIHSKNLKLFKISKSRQTIHNYVSKSKDEPKKIFIFLVFLNSAVKALKIRINNLVN
jgi:hypothetical protein